MVESAIQKKYIVFFVFPWCSLWNYRSAKSRAHPLSAFAFMEIGTGRLSSQTFRAILFIIFSFFLITSTEAQNSTRTQIAINENWRTVADDHKNAAFNGFESASYNDAKWKKVNVPHNWDGYEGYRRMRHGNRHGYAWYRKSFSVKPQAKGKRYFLFFEGVGSYATIWLNGKQVGYHAGGRTTFTLDVTDVIKLDGQQNLLAVRADHPANIRDLPWVCGGCSDERGFSEGSQPMGIFRPVHLIVTNDVRIEPFGVHIWNDTTVSERSAQLYFETEIKNYSKTNKNIVLINRLLDKGGVVVAQTSSTNKIGSSQILKIKQNPPLVSSAKLWSIENPYLYKLVTQIFENGKLIDQTSTPYGIRWISWPIGKNSKQFLLNGKPVFINGIAEYEHMLGGSHAFTEEEIKARVMMIKAAGFNAFRDAHHPHNLRYQNYWDSLGILWWTQMGAHVWFDTPAFRENFKASLREWVKERRNSPSLVLWGLQNESKLPEDFARECTAIIREMDATTSSQRLVTTCNGGSGTDWDVPQNWTGTYGGDPATYGEDLKKQVLVGEYGAWRTIDLHSEDDSYQSNIYSEERFCNLLETKIRLAESVKDSIAGHFMWLFNSHDNPGRVQAGEGYRELDRIGPVNYKGLFTPWGEPTDAFYLYRSNYVDKNKEPMVYIVSHTWPSRWTSPGVKNGIVVYSNCDEVELFNDVNAQSLGKRKRNGIGTHFQWDDVDIRYDVLYAIGYVHGKEVAKDYIVLNHLPSSPHSADLLHGYPISTTPFPEYNYLYRVNCGGGDYTDPHGSNWMADRERVDNECWGSTSWTGSFKGMPAYFASQRKSFDPTYRETDLKLFQSFRYGREDLQYFFPVTNGEYLVELYFIEPWLGRGGGMDCTGWRTFDIAVNGKTVIRNLDIWKEVGLNKVFRTSFKIKVTSGKLIIHFPHVASGQAVISAIAIATMNKNAKPAPSPVPLMKILNQSEIWPVETWLDLDDEQYSDSKACFSSIPSELYGAEWIKMPHMVKLNRPLPAIELNREADIFIGVDSSLAQPSWLKEFTNTKTTIQNDKGDVFLILKKRFSKGQRLSLEGERIPSPTEQKYLVMAQPAANIEPAYDLKPIATYKAVDAKWRGTAIEKGQVDGKDRIIFKKASADNVLEWNFPVGVGDMYSLQISYNNSLNSNINGKLQLLSADGTLMKEEEITFTPTKEGKSNYINTTTGTMINAGTYILRLTSKDAEGLSINALDVQ